MAVHVEEDVQTTPWIADGRGREVATCLAPGLGTNTNLFLLIDASRAQEIVDTIETLSDTAKCLFDGRAEDDLFRVGPWLVPMELGDDIYNWFFEDGWGNDWGLLLASPQNGPRLKSSLKRSIMVKDDEGRELFFKFYRPSVFNSFVPAFAPEQAEYLMRDLSWVCAEASDDPNCIFIHRMKANRLQSHKKSLDATTQED